MAGIVDQSEVLLAIGLSGSPTETERALVQECLDHAESAVIRYLQYDPVQKTHTEFFPQMNFLDGIGENVWEATDTTAYVRRLAQAQSDELQVTHIPVRSITSLYIDYDGRNGTKTGAFPENTLQVQGRDYWPNFDQRDSSNNPICMDGIIKSIGRWPAEPGSIKITYVAGYTEDELRGRDNIINAGGIYKTALNEAVREVQTTYSRMKKARVGFVGGPFTHERLGDYSYSLDTISVRRFVGSEMDLLFESQSRLQQYLRYDMGVR